MRDLRLLPIVTLAAGGLLFLKAVGILSGDVTGPRQVRAQDSSIPGLESPADANLVTGATPAAAPAAAATPAAAPAGARPGQPTPMPAQTQAPAVSASERAILERLQERRQELDTRHRELDMRENLLRATERRLEQRANELRELETRIAGLEQRRDEAEQARFRGVVSMYESMRPKDAARIFDSLDMSVLIEVARAMRPPKLADVIAQMQAEQAKRLTTELARRPNQTASVDPRGVSPDTLPKIEGRPSR
ncbi:MotE family protein [Phreatobacter sp. HK31-P]